MYVNSSTKLPDVTADNPGNIFEDGNRLLVGKIEIITGKTDNGINNVVYDDGAVKGGNVGKEENKEPKEENKPGRPGIEKPTLSGDPA